MNKRKETKLIHAGRSAQQFDGSVNPPLTRSSTVLIPSVDDLYGTTKKTYGRMGHEVHRVLETGLCELENARHVHLTPNGVSACTVAIAAMVKSGDHLLFADSVYGPTRRFCERFLRKMGVEAESFPARCGADISKWIRPNTTCIFLESPGSLTFEFSDTPAIVEIAKASGIKTILDNTWGVGLHHRPLELDVDISVQALTKYVIGHADAFAGVIMSVDDGIAAKVKESIDDLGQCCGPEEAYLAQRGLRTLATRLAQHEASGLEIANWLAEREEVIQVIHPARDDHPDHAIWKRDFTGSCGLFSFVLAPMSEVQISAFFADFKLFGHGFSWGGFESLIIPCNGQLKRNHPNSLPSPRGELVRLHVGLEHPKDLIADLEAAFDRARNA